MNTLEMMITQFIDEITQDIQNAKKKGWLKTAIISHCSQQFPGVEHQYMSTIVSMWYNC